MRRDSPSGEPLRFSDQQNYGDKFLTNVSGAQSVGADASSAPRTLGEAKGSVMGPWIGHRALTRSGPCIVLRATPDEASGAMTRSRPGT